MKIISVLQINMEKNKPKHFEAKTNYKRHKFLREKFKIKKKSWDRSLIEFTTILMGL